MGGCVGGVNLDEMGDRVVGGGVWWWMRSVSCSVECVTFAASEFGRHLWVAVLLGALLSLCFLGTVARAAGAKGCGPGLLPTQSVCPRPSMVRERLHSERGLHGFMSTVQGRAAQRPIAGLWPPPLGVEVPPVGA